MSLAAIRALALVAGTLAAWPRPAAAGDEDPARFHGHGHEDHDHGRHFLHPLIAESPLPDTKLRLDHVYRGGEAADEHTVRLESEYALAPWISVEADVPYTIRDPDAGPSRSNLDTVELGVKLASFALARHGVLLGGGFEIGLPTGSDAKGIGSGREVELAPFLDAGVRHGRFQAIGFVEFGVPVNQPADEADEVDLEIGFNAAFAYRLSDRVLPLLEFDGETIAAGHDNATTVNVTPGVIVHPLESRDVMLGFGVSVPLTTDRAFDARTILSAFYHF